MRKTRTTPIGASSFAIRIDSYQDCILSGAINGPMLSKPLAFSSFMELALCLDDILDAEVEDVKMPAPLGDDLFHANLELDVLFRQNHSWQGRLRSIDDGVEASFHSVLELMGIIDMLFGE